MISTLYRGSVKDVLGPVTLSGLGGGTPEGVVFEYTDAYSVFDWGKMPDLLAHKGEALAVIAAELFERLERPDTWRDFSRTQEAFDLRKESHFGAVFNEIGEKLQKEGLRTHYLGVLSEKPGATSVQARMIKDVTRSVHHILARRVTAERPKLVQILGRTVPDYHVTRQSKPPRLIPLEVVFRFSCPPGSSYKAEPGQKWNFPVLQLFTKLENSDRLVDIAEALAISGVPGEVLQEMLLKTAWVSTLLKSLCSAAGFELADGKLEWAVNEAGECILVDAIGPDELRILRGGVQLSKEVLRDCYKSTEWYASVVEAKKQATEQGVADWKRLVQTGPQPLTVAQRDLASNMYMALANTLTGRLWFPDAWSIDRVVQEIKGDSQ